MNHMQVLDSHHHCWKYDAAEYPWIPSGSPLQADYGPRELESLASAHGVSGFVAVQARQSLAETRWLLALAEQTSLIRGVVGWFPLHSDHLDAEVAEFITGEHASTSKLKGVRHVVQDEPDERFLLGDDFNRGIGRLQSWDLTYDILIYATQLSSTIEFVDLHPAQRFVLDHIAKPRIKRGTVDPLWTEQLQRLAERPHVHCKFSGITTEMLHTDWSVDDLKPYWDVVWDAFGPRRVMYGSDWPVCLLRTSYAAWIEAVRELTARLSTDEQQAFWHGNAQSFYRLAPHPDQVD